MEEQDRFERLLSRSAWARDLGIVAAVSALPALFVFLPTGYCHPYTPGPAMVSLLAVFAAAGAALIGLAIPTLLHRRVRSKPLVLLVPAAAGLGALVGGASTLLATWIVGEPSTAMITLGASVGAAQLGLFWLPYSILRARYRAGFIAVLCACAAAPIIGRLALLHVVG